LISQGLQPAARTNDHHVSNLDPALSREKYFSHRASPQLVAGPPLIPVTTQPSTAHGVTLPQFFEAAFLFSLFTSVVLGVVTGAASHLALSPT